MSEAGIVVRSRGKTAGRGRFLFRFSTAVMALLCGYLPQSARAGDGAFEVFLSRRFALYIEHGLLLSGVTAGVMGNSRQAAPERDIGSNALLVLEGVHRDLAPHLGEAINQRVVVRFVSPSTFYRETNAPQWTSALFSHGEIRIPVSGESILKSELLQRNLRHEYIHAVAAQLSDYRCPAWLDEGLAQIFEGEFAPELAPALAQWAKHSDPLPLKQLQRGFTRLDPDLVVVAYAQSIFAVQALFDRVGKTAVVRYLETLSDGRPWEQSFPEAFGLSVAQFESELATSIRKWARSFREADQAYIAFAGDLLR